MLTVEKRTKKWGKWLEGDVEVGIDSLFFFFLFQVGTVIMYLYADSSNLVEKEVWLEQEWCPGRRDLVGR